jgi:hypothetical protein
MRPQRDFFFQTSTCGGLIQAKQISTPKKALVICLEQAVLHGTIETISSKQTNPSVFMHLLPNKQSRQMFRTFFHCSVDRTTASER